MSISLVSDGMLWPKAYTRFIKEQFVDIDATITDPWCVASAIDEVVEVSAVVNMESDCAVVEVESVGEVTGCDVDTDDIDGC